MNRNLIYSNAVFAIACLAFCGGCNISFNGVIGSGVKGSGVTATEQRELATFDSIDISGAPNVRIYCGVDPTCSVTADDNLLPLIMTNVTGQTLKIGSTESYSTRIGVSLDLGTEELTLLEVSGATNAEIVDCNSNELTIHLSGSGDIVASGSVKKLTVRVSGAAKIDMAKLNAEEVDIDLSGAASATVCASSKLKAEVSGVGSIDYYGDPEVDKNISGMGSVTRKGDIE